MGRKSVKENKNVYQQAREELGLSRDAAAEILTFVSSDRIEKIESEKTLPRPEEVLRMAACYKKPQLANYYCSHECPIGQERVPEIELKDLSQIILEMIATLNTLNNRKERLIEITVDGKITEDEREDFDDIRRKLDVMSKDINALSLWVENAVNTGDME